VAPRAGVEQSFFNRGWARIALWIIDPCSRGVPLEKSASIDVHPWFLNIGLDQLMLLLISVKSD
jgi:hypothetical protein